MRGAPVFHSIRLPAGQASRVHGEEAAEAHANDGEIGALPNGCPSGPSSYRGTVDSARMQRTNLRHTPLFPSSGRRECSHFRRTKEKNVENLPRRERSRREERE